MNSVLNALAYFGDALTGERLHYADSRHGADSRFTAAAQILLCSDVQPNRNAPGHYLIQSDENIDKYYAVCGIPKELSCDCEDATISDFNPFGICKHQIAAAMRWAIEQA